MMENCLVPSPSPEGRWPIKSGTVTMGPKVGGSYTSPSPTFTMQSSGGRDGVSGDWGASEEALRASG